MILLEIIAFVILTFPTAYELWSDRKGETPEQKKKDVRVRAFMMITAAGIVTGIITPKIYPWVTSVHMWPLTLTYLKCLFMSFAIFFLVFDYCIAAILIHRGIIETKESAFTYTGKTSKFDKFSLWVRIGPWGRFAVKMAVFIGALIWYF